MKKLLATGLSISFLLLSSCSLSNDDENNNNGNPNQPTSQNLSGNLTSNLTLSSGTEYLLNGALFVKEGATLTIEAGVTVKALAGGTDVYLLVEKGGKIIANGTSASPIIFTSSASNPAAGDWGGLILNGKAPLSRQNGTASNAATEINTSISFGGDVADDNSGVLNYVKLEYTGARIDDTAEHNGLTLNGVGTGTTITNIAIFNGDDDAIEFFGGTVNVINLLVVNAKDDMFDYTQGYTGTCTNLYGIRENGYTAVTSDPRGVEADGNLDGNSPSDINQSVFTINKLTIINKANGVVMSDAIKIRRGATANITNAYVELESGASYADFIDLEDSKGTANANTNITAIGNATNGLDITDNKNSIGATLTLSNGTSGGADATVFAWTGYSF